MPNNRFLKAINSLLELEKDKGLKIQKKDRKTKRETEKLFYKPIIVSKDDTDKFKEQEMKKIKQSVMGNKQKIINDIPNIYLNRRRKWKRKKKKHNERIIKDWIIRDIRKLFEQEEEYYEPKGVSKFLIINTLNMRVMVIKIKTYQLMNSLIILSLT